MYSSLVKTSPFASLMMFLLIVFGGFFVASFCSVAIGMIMLSLQNSTVGFWELAQNFEKYPELKGIMLAMQASNSFVLFVLTPIFYFKFIEKASLKPLFPSLPSQWHVTIIITGLISISFFPFSGWMVFLNQSFQFPESLAWLEESLRATEEQMQSLSNYMTDFDSWGEFLVGLVVIAVLPGIGEELLFRGVLQTKIHKLLGNVHVAIWLTAFLFSAFHQQFFGLLPRMFLGALFGYLYIWSGNLIYPMVAHFLNNGLTLFFLFLYTRLNDSGEMAFDIASSESYPIGAAFLSLLIVSGLLLLFKKMNSETNLNAGFLS